MKDLDKIYKCLKSCNTLEQYTNAFNMLLRYSMSRPNDIGVVIFMTKVQEYALIKGRNLIANY